MKEWVVFVRECMRGKSLLRTFQNIDLKNNCFLDGDVIDLGAKNGTSSYYRFVNKSEETKITYTDLYSDRDEVLRIDFNKPFGIEFESYDAILALNVLEHIWETKVFLSESYGILRAGGKIHGVVPFLHKYHADPCDYWRFTHEALEKLLLEAGFKNICVRPHGIGSFTVAAHQFSGLLIFRPLIVVIWLLSILLDRVASKFLNKNRQYYLGIYFCAEK